MCTKCGANCELSPRKISKAAKPMDKEEFLRAAVQLVKLAEELQRMPELEHMPRETVDKVIYIKRRAEVIEKMAWDSLNLDQQKALEKQMIIWDPSRLDKMSYADITALEV